MTDGLLNGVRVLDLSDEPLAHGARLLADLGADVVRVEHARGDALRRRPPFLDDAEGDVERGYAHLLYNGGKRSLAVDTEDPAIWAALTPLIEHVRHRDRAAAPQSCAGGVAGQSRRLAARDSCGRLCVSANRPGERR